MVSVQEYLRKSLQFQESPLWIEYSHKRYLTLEAIQRRLNIRGTEWETARELLQATRQLQSRHFSIPCIQKLFWFFEADCIKQKLSEVERLGTRLYDRIHSTQSFEKDFIINAATEEAVTSAIYEGANTTRAKALEFLAEGRPAADRSERMLVNNYEALNWIRSHRSDPIDSKLVLKIHAIVTHRTLESGNEEYSGKFRDDRVFVGPHEGIVFDKIEEALEQMFKGVEKNSRFIHPLLQGILLHYFLGYIHPFFDGNGRTARTLFYFKAIQNDYRFVELLSISAHLKDHGRQYEAAFERSVEHDHDLTYFVDFALDSLLSALKIVEEKADFLSRIHLLKTPLDLSDHQIRLLQKLALNKFKRISSEEYAQQTDRSREMARLELKQLVATEMVREVKGSGRRLLYQIHPKKLRERLDPIRSPT